MKLRQAETGVYGEMLKKLFAIVIVGLAAWWFGAGGQFGGQAGEQVIMVPDDDSAMNTAMARARETLPQFWTAFDNQSSGYSGLALKVEITDGNGSEHFWLNNISRNGEAWNGNINNEPQIVKTVQYGQAYSFSRKEVSDWMYIEGGKIYGGFTIRVLLDKMPKAEADRLRAMLAFEPK